MGVSPSGPGVHGATEAYLAEVLERLRRVLHRDVAGVYLIGSLAVGGYVPGRSDIDVAVITLDRSDRAVLEGLVRLLAHPGLPCPAPKLELVVYPRAALQGDRPSLEWTLNLNTGPEVGLRASYDPAEEPPHWFVLDVAMAREHARPLLGGPPRQAFAAIDRSRVLAALLESLQWHGGHDARGVDTVLNGCRALLFAVEGRWSSKDDAGAWGRSHAPDPELVAAALAARHGGSTEPARDRVLAFRAAVTARLEREASERGPGPPVSPR